ncbi:NlpC/P60 family protein [Streptomyces sp. NPDC017179]|uniref:C40 family peptidase n=1 Tax=Streptomyces sp. NPDC017179 TaxID=3364979 RepID=UPI00379249C2
MASHSSTRPAATPGPGTRGADGAGPSPEEIERKLDYLYGRAGSSTARRDTAEKDGAQKRGARQRGLVAALLDDVAKRTDMLGRAREMLGSFAAAPNRSGDGTPETAALLLTETPQGYFDQAQLIGRLNARRESLADGPGARPPAPGATAPVLPEPPDEQQHDIGASKAAVQRKLAHARVLLSAHHAHEATPTTEPAPRPQAAENAQNTTTSARQTDSTTSGTPTGMSPEHAADGFPEQTVGAFPEQATGVFPGQTPGMPPEHPVGGFPEQATGGFPVQTPHLAPEQTAAVSPGHAPGMSEQTAGIPPEHAVGGFPEQATGGFPVQTPHLPPEHPVGGFPEQTPGMFPEQTPGMFPEQASGVLAEQASGVLPGWAPGSTAATRADQALAFAREQIGKPYVWGAAGPGSYDCSGLTQAAWKAAGVTLPRAARDQAQAGTAVPLSEARPGDLVFFAFFDDAEHVGLYAGDGVLIHAPRPGDRVREESVHHDGASAAHRVVRPA